MQIETTSLPGILVLAPPSFGEAGALTGALSLHQWRNSHFVSNHPVRIWREINGLPVLLAAADSRPSGGTVFGYRVADPERYGVAFDPDGKASAIIEKPEVPPSDYAVTGLYFLNGTAPARAVKASARGELEITTLLESYLHEGSLTVERMGRGFAWLDTGTHASLLDAGNFVRTLEQRHGLQTGCPEEIAFEAGWIADDDLHRQAAKYVKSDYGAYLLFQMNDGAL